MFKKKNVSLAVVRRLPRYLRYVEDLLNHDIMRISSSELSQRMGYTASQVRQDFNNFGGFGQQGYGYSTQVLYENLVKILGLDKNFKMIIVGVGNLGQALANYANFYKKGFRLVGLFDVDPQKVGKSIRNIKIQHIDELKDFIKKNDVDIGVLCVPSEVAQEVANLMVEGGIKGIWNFTAKEIEVKDDVVVENVHLIDSLMVLSYKLNEKLLEKQEASQK
ncbi:CoA-binding domain protein [Caldicellulosiruptor saccharolyticus DSM 8903]|uniref:Redox-sensing transcriptional repressor Rex n=1 Tax=Caldicellulosiruptor saccharolyticus (strain ATCC 43494 / DSM 8903 / Tp8T 6331) TaxID=351627 RepID=REX_CALS8|nr:redox-sensing transcriptional repressor Rex [Caldicellulosiruptor saccharolyticus]A4XIT8.1 RecName: Full=Redox-sensing transcriptional repressor Rex [Caldicellulosiruptor saccharolyticus DSM 8903]ABP66823.1 CoA-binding domain protein [Caldicellulosiruptor saccharolyticus DSM 8903]